MDTAQVREELGRIRLDVSDVASDPISQFHAWFEQWANLNPNAADTMVLSTVDADGGMPAVLLKFKPVVFDTRRRSLRQAT